MRLTPCEAPTQSPDLNTGNYVPYSLQSVCGNIHKAFTKGGCETGPMVYRPYLRRLESLTICKCHYMKGSTFSSVNKSQMIKR